jgi:YD repeat-containing protein
MGCLDMRAAGALRAGVFLLAMWCAQSAPAGTVSYSYDSLGRVTTVVYSDGTTTKTIRYSYDANGNRTSVTTTSP